MEEAKARVDRLLKHMEDDSDGKRSANALAALVDKYGFKEMKAAGDAGVKASGLHGGKITYILTCSSTLTLDPTVTVNAVQTNRIDGTADVFKVDAYGQQMSALPPLMGYQPSKIEIVPPQSQASNILKMLAGNNPNLPTVWVHDRTLSGGKYNGIWMSGRSALINVEANLVMIDGLP